MSTNNGKKNGKMGRPSKIDTIDTKKLGLLASFGLTDEELAQFFDITRVTLHNYKKKYPDIFNTLKAGKDAHDDEVEESLRRKARGHVGPDGKYYPPDSTACIFWLKNRRKQDWRDRQEIEHSGEIGHAVQWEGKPEDVMSDLRIGEHVK